VVEPAPLRSTAAMTGPNRLNLGCGRFPKPGYLNVDWTPTPGVDLVHDLSKLPYPFASGSFERIEADHVLEHLPNVFGVMREVHRMLVPGGTFVMRVPHFSRGFSHPEHCRGFDATFPYYFNPVFPGGYAGVEFESVRTHLTWNAQPYLKRTVLRPGAFLIAKTVGVAIDALANASPLAASRLWCFMVGGFEEIEFVLKKPGPG
jgi:SAM-dependent methyltransferase